MQIKVHFSKCLCFLSFSVGVVSCYYKSIYYNKSTIKRVLLQLERRLLFKIFGGTNRKFSTVIINYASLRRDINSNFIKNIFQKKINVGVNGNLYFKKYIWCTNKKYHIRDWMFSNFNNIYQFLAVVEQFGIFFNNYGVHCIN